MRPEFTPDDCRRVLIAAGLLTIFQMTADEVHYALWSAMFWAGDSFVAGDGGVE